jgi:hypothetical protein
LLVLLAQVPVLPLLQAEPLLQVYPQAQSLVPARLVQESLVVLA